MQRSFSTPNALRRGYGKPRRPAPKRHRLSFDFLEDRRLLSAGDLDPSFGSGGIAATPLVAGAPAYGGTGNVGGAVDSSGRVVVVGQINSHDIGLARYNTDGSLDTTFGSGGIVDTSLGTYNSTYGTYSAAAHEVAIDPSTGKILVLANMVLPYSNRPLIPVQNEAFVLLRYNTNGTLDTTFGQSAKHGGHTGYTTTMVAGNCSMDEPQALALDSQGRIVVDGYVGAYTNAVGNVVLLRYTSAGALDTTFGSKGTLLYGTNATTSDMKVQPDNKIVVGTYTPGSATKPPDFAVHRFTTSGTADSTFGTGGLVTTDFGAQQSEIIDNVLIQSNGDIVAVGTAAQAGPNGTVVDVGLARYTPSGQFDTTFGAGGIAYGPALADGRYDAATLDEAGRAVVATPDFITRFTTEGAIDTSFEPATGGVAPTSAATLRASLFLSPSDEIYDLVGTSGGIGIARYLGDSGTPSSPADSLLSSAAPTSLPNGSGPASTDAVFAAYAYPEDDDTLD